MSEPATTPLPDLEAKVVARAWADEDFRERLKADPRAAVAEKTGIAVPESITSCSTRRLPRRAAIEVLEETPDKAYLVIPADRAGIPDEELDLAGGSSPYDPRR